jgi:hypothetical protein
MGLVRGLGRAFLAHPILLGLMLIAAVALKFRHHLARPRSQARAASDAPSATPTLTPAMKDLLTRLDALFAQRGSPRRPSRAPREHALDPGVLLAADERAARVRAADLLYSTAYGGRTQDPHKVAAVTANLVAHGGRTL